MKKSELQRMIQEELRLVLKEGVPDDPWVKSVSKATEILDKYLDKPNPPFENFHKNWASSIDFVIRGLEAQKKKLLALDKKKG